MATEFFVVMEKRNDGQAFADLHKTDGRFYLTREEADAALQNKGELSRYFQVESLISLTPSEYLQVGDKN